MSKERAGDGGKRKTDNSADVLSMSICVLTERKCTAAITIRMNDS